MGLQRLDDVDAIGQVLRQQLQPVPGGRDAHRLARGVAVGGDRVLRDGLLDHVGRLVAQARVAVAHDPVRGMTGGGCLARERREQREVTGDGLVASCDVAVREGSRVFGGQPLEQLQLVVALEEIHDGGEHLVLGREMAEKPRVADAGGGGDVAERRGAVPAGHEGIVRRGHDGGSRPLGARSADGARRRSGGHVVAPPLCVSPMSPILSLTAYQSVWFQLPNGQDSCIVVH